MTICLDSVVGSVVVRSAGTCSIGPVDSSAAKSLGDTRKLKLEAARKVARNIFARVELGHDPAADRAKAKAESAAVHSSSDR